MTLQEKTVIDKFHDLYYWGPEGEGQIFSRTKWMNVPCLKCPLDLWIYQEIISEVQPDLIIETGSYLGGSALFMAHVLDIIGKGELITIDIQDHPRLGHPRVRYVSGSSTDEDLVKSLLSGRRPEMRMVILDSTMQKIMF